MRLVVSVVGPTAVGKTALSLSLAQTAGGEIINADSRQVYRYMDIGTAKPSREERSLVPHHIIDIINPDETFDLATYQKMAYELIRSIHDRGRTPILVGGTGMYTWSVLEGWNIPEVPPDMKLRKQLEERAAREGRETLYRELQELDPEAAAKIHPHNLRRVIRGLEVHSSTGRRLSEMQTKSAPGFDCLIIGLTATRQKVYSMIDERVERMVEQGLVDEVRSLIDRGYGLDLPSMATVGYKQIGQFIKGESALPAAVQKIKYETHRLALHQYGWFRLSDPRIKWIDVEEGHVEEGAAELVRTYAGA